MPNSTNINTALEIYSAKFIEALSALLPALREFSLDLSDDAVNPGDRIRVPLVSADPATTWNDDTNHYGRPEADLKDRVVPLDKRIIAGFSITQDQMSKFHPHWWEGKGVLNARAIANAVLTSIFSKVTPGTFGDKPADKFSLELAGFNSEMVAAVRGHIAGKNLAPSEAVMLLNSVYFSKLLGTLNADIYGGREAIASGVIPGLLGFKSIIEAPQLTIPGFVAHPNALAAASRRVPILDTTPYKEFGAITEPNTGLTLNRVIYTDGQTGKTSFSVECMYGAEAGNKDALVRLESAAA